jgi:hypothetical protein
MEVRFVKDVTPTPSTGTAFASFDDVNRIEAFGYAAGCFYLWARLHDGRAVLWNFQLGAWPGQDQRLRVIPGA